MDSNRMPAWLPQRRGRGRSLPLSIAESRHQHGQKDRNPDPAFLSMKACVIAVSGVTLRHIDIMVNRQGPSCHAVTSAESIVLHTSVGSRPGKSPVVAMAPALIIGFAGRPEMGSRLMALNASPDGSTPTFWKTASALGAQARLRIRKVSKSIGL